jgi:uncharacterized membrane protein YdjX (TVP38/TMEM64 family)
MQVDDSWLQRLWETVRAPENRARLIAAGIWLTLLLLYEWLTLARGWQQGALLLVLVNWMETHPLGPVVLLLAFVVQAFLFVPTGLLGVAAGHLYGISAGLLLTLIGTGLAAAAAYATGRFFGGDHLASAHDDSRMASIATRLRRNGFVTILVMRLLWLPFDLVSYLAGFLRIAFGPFLLATFIGAIPPSLAYVLLGSAVEADLASGRIALDPRIAGLSLLLFLLSIGLWWIFRRAA